MTEEIQNTVTQSSNPTTVDVEGCVALYVELRDRIAAIQAEQIEKTKPLQAAKERLDGILLKHLQDQGAQNIKTASGTIYQRVAASAPIKDKKAFREFVVTNQQFDMLDWKANKVAVRTYMEENQTDVPGVNFTATLTIGVRRGSGTNSDQEE